jgi:carboxyl-terminal processing protease
MLILLCSGVLLVAVRGAVAEPEQIKALLRQAELYEQQADWDKACDVYEAVLRLQRGSPQIRQRYQHCLRRFWQTRRFRDVSYHKEVLSLEYGQALRLYGVIRDTLLDHSLEKKKLDAGKLFRKGLEELDTALADPAFCQQYIPAATPSDVQAFRTLLSKTWGDARPPNRHDALRQLREVALTAQGYLQLDATVVIMEFACGACYALDEYTVYLTPSQLSELCHSLKGEIGSGGPVGVGLTLMMQDGRVLIHEVAPFSPAAQYLPPLEKGFQLISIDKKAVAALPLDTIRDLLEGPEGSAVVLEVLTAMGPRTVPLRRRAEFLQSVRGWMQTSSVAYLNIASFHQTTAQEIDQHLAALNQAGMKSLILDLRGNSGGLFDAAIDVARRFLTSGIITSTRHLDPKFDTVYQARNAAALTVPMIVLVDGDTASAAEVLAGSLKENNRARLVGQTTFGKGCTQYVLKLPNSSGGVPTGGLRLTVARFYSPKGEAYSGRGILPDIFVERTLPGDTSLLSPDQQIQTAVLELQRHLGPQR